MRYRRMPIEVESPEERGYGTIACNLSESSVWDARLEDLQLNLQNLVLCYGEHRGSLGLREAIASGLAGVETSDVLVVPGAAAALFIVNSCLLDRDSSLLVVRPNYSTNIETPRLLGCSVNYLELKFENKYELDLEEIRNRIAPNTKLISITYPHNPTGVTISETKLRALIEIVERWGCCLLVDETYRDLHRGACPPLAASLSPNVISVSSLSKAYGLPGIRIGWLVCKNPQLQELFLAAKEQILICNSVVDEEIARMVLARREKIITGIQTRVAECAEMVGDWIGREPRLEWVAPQGGVVCFPRIRESAAVDTVAFYRLLLDQFGTYVGPGRWFEQSDRYFRLGYGWEPKEKLAVGLAHISEALTLAQRD